MLRTGSCNRCGQCCGADGSPYQHNPWPRRWPRAVRNWHLADLVDQWPQALLFGTITKGDGTIGSTTDYGTTRITGGGPPRDYYWAIVPDNGICKDISGAHDGSSYSLECPFLLPNPGDGTRPCGLVGTNEDNAFRVACEIAPPMEKTAEEVVQWQMRHPLCSYIWS